MNTQQYARPELLADTEWLEEHLDDSNIRIVDCDGFEEYRRAHIKGSVGIQVHHYIKHPKYVSDSHEYPWVAEAEVMKTLMEKMGIGDDTLVIAYDASGSLYATRFWWVLNYYGHKNVKVLNGGWRKWFEEGRPTTLARPTNVSVSFNPKPDASLICTLDYGLDHIGDQNTIFLDVRSESEWDGTNDRGNNRSGHIPGAVHIEWLNFLNQDQHRTFKSAEELHSIFETLGVSPDKNVIPY